MRKPPLPATSGFLETNLEKIQNKKQITEKNIFSRGKKKTKSFAIDRERASSEISVECSYGIFFFFFKIRRKRD